MPATYEPIATANGTGSSATITFSSIPATYTDLRVIIQATSPASGQYVSPGMRFNSDSGSNYSYTVLWGDGSSAGSYRVNNQTSFYAGPSQVGVQNLNPCLSVVDILNYTASMNKTSLIEGMLDDNGSGSTERIVSLWRNTAAITTVAVISQGASFSTSTVVTIYGIKAA
jgi:hypothetical protein